MNVIPLSDAPQGEVLYVNEIHSKGAIRRRFQDIGITEGPNIVSVIKSPLGDPCAYLVCGSLIAIRNNDAKNILVSLRR